MASAAAGIGEPVQFIRGGEAVKPGELGSLAFVAYLIPNGKGEALTCSGTVIAPRLVLTAAHCVDPPEVNVEVENFRVITGDVNVGASDREVLAVRDTWKFSRYSPYGGRGDAGVLELAEPTRAPSMRLAARRFWSSGDEAEIAGWGVLHPQRHRPTYVLHRTATDVLGFRECMLEDGVRGQICTEDLARGKSSACYGDSGGPLLMRRPGDGRLVEVGITHGGSGGCNPRRANFFTATTSIDRWVHRRIAKTRGAAP